MQDVCHSEDELEISGVAISVAGQTMSSWLSTAIATYGRTELISQYRFQSRQIVKNPPSCFGMETPRYFLDRCGSAAQDPDFTDVYTYSNVVLHHGDVFGLDQIPYIPGQIGFIPQSAEAINGNLEFDSSVVFNDPQILATTHHSAHNYYHFMTDYLTNYKYAVFIDKGATPFFVSKNTSQFHYSAMKLLYGECFPLRFFATSYFFRRLAIPSLLPKSEVVDFLRKSSEGISSSGSGRRIYVTRRNASVRRVINELELYSCLHKYGFEIVDNELLSLAQQIALFKSADIICAPHGAGLTNIAFCKEGSAVVEILLTERLPLSGVFWELGSAAKLDYYLVHASRVHNDTHPYEGEGDLYVDPRFLEEAIVEAIERPRSMSQPLSIQDKR